MHELFPELIGNQIEAWELKGIIGKDRESGMISMDSYSNLIQILEEELTDTEKVLEIFRIEGVGYVMFVYSVNSFDSKARLEIYLLPENDRVFVSNPYLSPYRSCWGKVD